MIKTVIFDWDGVLVDSLQDIHEWFIYICNKNNKKYICKTKEEFSNSLVEPYIAYYEGLGFNWEEDKKMLAQEFRDYFDKVELKTIEEMPAFLKILKENDLKLAIVSSSREKVIKTSLEKLNLTSYFDLIIGHEDNFNPKPSPDCLNITIKKLSINLDNVIYIGDSITDIQAAKAAKIKSIAVTWGFHNKERLLKENPDFIVDNIEELKQVILNGRL